eukprot:SAG31_NODE_3719_length_3951_cov_2.328141_3_plen_669_part_00
MDYNLLKDSAASYAAAAYGAVDMSSMQPLPSSAFFAQHTAARAYGAVQGQLHRIDALRRDALLSANQRAQLEHYAQEPHTLAATQFLDAQEQKATLEANRAAVEAANTARTAAAKAEQRNLQTALSIDSQLNLVATDESSASNLSARLIGTKIPNLAQSQNADESHEPRHATLFPFEKDSAWDRWARSVETENAHIHRSTSSLDRVVVGKEEQAALQRALSISSELSLAAAEQPGDDGGSGIGIRSAAAALSGKVEQRSWQQKLAAGSPLKLFETVHARDAAAVQLQSTVSLCPRTASVPSSMSSQALPPPRSSSSASLTAQLDMQQRLAEESPLFLEEAEEPLSIEDTDCGVAISEWVALETGSPKSDDKPLHVAASPMENSHKVVDNNHYPVNKRRGHRKIFSMELEVDPQTLQLLNSDEAAQSTQVDRGSLGPLHVAQIQTWLDESAQHHSVEIQKGMQEHLAATSPLSLRTATADEPDFHLKQGKQDAEIRVAIGPTGAKLAEPDDLGPAAQRATQLLDQLLDELSPPRTGTNNLPGRPTSAGASMSDRICTDPVRAAVTIQVKYLRELCGRLGSRGFLTVKERSAIVEAAVAAANAVDEAASPLRALALIVDSANVVGYSAPYPTSRGGERRRMGRGAPTSCEGTSATASRTVVIVILSEFYV